MTDTRLTRTFGDNNPIHSHLGLATTAYSYALSYDELTEVAERIALLLNLHLGDSTVDLRNPLPETNLMGHSLTSPSHGENSRLGDQNDDRPKDSLACPRAGSCVCGNDHSTPNVWQLRHGGQDGHDWIYGDPARVAFGDFSSGAFSRSVLSAALLPRQNGEPVAYRYRLAVSSEWYASNAGDMDGVRECMWHLGDQLEIEPLFAMAKSDDNPAGSRSMDEASLPTTSRLSQLEARTSCAVSINDQLTPPRAQPQKLVSQEAMMILPAFGLSPAETSKPLVDDCLLHPLKPASDDTDENHHDAEQEARCRKPSPISLTAKGRWKIIPTIVKKW